MPTGNTSLLGLALPVQGELSGTWGDVVNQSITELVDSAVAGTTVLSADSDVTLTTTALAANQARQAILRWTASNGATTRNITAPAQSKPYIVINAGTGSIVLRGAGPTAGITIVAGERCLAAWNGSDFVKIATTASGAAAGSNTQIQFNSSGSLAGSANMTFNGTRLTVADLADSGLTSGRVTYASTDGALVDSANLTFDGTNLTLGGGTANGVAYLNGSKVLTTGSGFNTDGTNIGVGVGASSDQRVYARTATSTGTAFYADNGVNTGFKVAFASALTSIGNDFNQPLAFLTNNSEQMRLTSTGLGIGTSSPLAKLHVSTSGAGIQEPMWLNNAQAVGAGVGARLVFTGTTNNNGLAAIDGAFAGATTADGGYMAFNTRAVTSGTLTERMRLDSSGNLGLGTTSPAYRLQVETPSATGNIVGYFRQGSGAVAAILSTTDLVGFGNGATAGETRIYADGGSGFVSFRTNGSERARITSGGNFGIGTTSPNSRLDVDANVAANTTVLSLTNRANWGWGIFLDFRTPLTDGAAVGLAGRISSLFESSNNYALAFSTTASGTNSERARITSGGQFLVGKTGTSASNVGCELRPTGQGTFTNAGDTCLIVNRTVNDGELVAFWQADVQEGNISVSGTTVSYNGGHLARWAQTTSPKDDTLLKGTVLSNLDEMNVYNDADGNPVKNEQLNKVKVSDVEGDVNVAGVFVNWTHDDAHDVDEINMAMTGDMIIRIAQGVTVQRGDLLMSAGDGTAKPQGDDIVRSKTVAKVTSTHVTCTYADGSFCVPCVLMAC